MLLRILAAAAALAPAVAAAQTIPVGAPTTASQPNVTTAEARRLVAWAAARAERRNMRICVAVSDADGHLLAFERMQGGYAGCVDAAIAKARSAARFRIQTNSFYEMVRDRNLGIGFIPDILPAVGGVPLKQGAAFVGAVGISGDRDETEQALAVETATQFR